MDQEIFFIKYKNIGRKYLKSHVVESPHTSLSHSFINTNKNRN